MGTYGRIVGGRTKMSREDKENTKRHTAYKVFAKAELTKVIERLYFYEHLFMCSFNI